MDRRRRSGQSTVWSPRGGGVRVQLSEVSRVETGLWKGGEGRTSAVAGFSLLSPKAAGRATSSGQRHGTGLAAGT